MAVNNVFPQFTECSPAEVPQCVQDDVKRVARMNGVSFDKNVKTNAEVIIIGIIVPTIAG